MMGDSLLRPEDAPSSYYGPDGRPQFFQDPAMDRFVAVLLNVASELWVQTEKVETLSRILERAGLSGAEVEAEIVTGDEAVREQALTAFMHRVFKPLRELEG
ncbi:MAG: hypothetical protein ABW169_10160 [Sphingobium sp.]